MKAAHWTLPFIGLPYERGAQGPVRWDCWSFFRMCQEHAFKRYIPFVPTPPTLAAMADALAAGPPAEAGWHKVDAPRDGDAVLMARLKFPTHVGIWVDDLRAVLHCTEGGSVLHDKFHLAASRWRACGFYSPAA